MSCFSLSATCHESHGDAEAALEYLDFLDESETLDGAGLISGSVILLPNDGGLEISGTEGEGEAKSSDVKSLTMRVTMAMIRCAFSEVHMEEEMSAEFWRRGQHRGRGGRVHRARRFVGRGIGGGIGGA